MRPVSQQPRAPFHYQSQGRLLAQWPVCDRYKRVDKAGLRIVPLLPACCCMRIDSATSNYSLLQAARGTTLLPTWGANEWGATSRKRCALENDIVRPVRVLVSRTFKNPFSSRDSRKHLSSGLIGKEALCLVYLISPADRPLCPLCLTTFNPTAHLDHGSSNHRHRQLLDHDQVDVGALAHGP